MGSTESANRNKSLYNVVAGWCRLKRYENYWRSFHFDSEFAFLDYYGFPEEATLRQLEVIVNLFDRPTFILLGEKILSNLLLRVSKYQQDVDEKKRDYQAIFDRYCKNHEAFDKTTFNLTMRNYLEAKYAKPEDGKADDGKAREEWIRRKEEKKRKGKPDPFQPGESKQRVIRKASGDQKYDPHVEHDFEWKTVYCTACKDKIAIIEDLLLQLKICEDMICNHLGKGEVPVRPPRIRDLHP
jgi:hypothetical protein